MSSPHRWSVINARLILILFWTLDGKVNKNESYSISTSKPQLLPMTSLDRLHESAMTLRETMIPRTLCLSSSGKGHMSLCLCPTDIYVDSLLSFSSTPRPLPSVCRRSSSIIRGSHPLLIADFYLATTASARWCRLSSVTHRCVGAS
jgi:hypothetical protein